MLGKKFYLHLELAPDVESSSIWSNAVVYKGANI